MSIYRYFFAATYAFYKRFKSEQTPVFSAACVLSVSQIFTLFSVLMYLKNKKLFNITDFMSNKLYWLPVAIVWVWLVYKYYSPRVGPIMEDFKSMPLIKRRWLNLVAILAFICPLVLFCMLAVK